MTNARLRCALLAALLVPVAMPGCVTDEPAAATDDGALEPVASVSQQVVTQGDWGAFTNGQCVIGVQNFYKAKFGVKLSATGLQSGNVGNCQYLGACMFWVSPKVQPDPGQWDRHDWGSVMPQTYDLVVYPPKPGTTGYGHVASVDHMEGGDPGAYGNLYIMDSNFNGNELKASSIHTFNRQPYGIYRLKALSTCAAHCQGNAVVDAQCHVSECGGSACVHDGLGPHCVYPACPSSGSAHACDGAGSVIDCVNGLVTSRVDCAAAGQVCSGEGAAAHCDAPPTGRLDEVGCERLGGWSQDPSVPAQSIAVHLYFDGPAGDPKAVGVPTSASVSRPDLCGPLGSCNHAFDFPTPRSLLDGQSHAVHAYGIDASGGANAEIGNSPLSLRCSPPSVSRSAVRRQVHDEASFVLWKFSTFQDVAPLAPADRVDPDLSSRGPDLPAAPRFVQADDSDEVWLIDGGVRRLVPGPAAVAAWHATSIEAWSSMQLYQTERGADLSDIPRLVQTEGPTYWLLDSATDAAPGVTPPTPPGTSTSPGKPAPTSTNGGDVPGSVKVSASGDEAVSGCSQSRPAGGSSSWLALLGATAWLARRASRARRARSL